MARVSRAISTGYGGPRKIFSRGGTPINADGNRFLSAFIGVYRRLEGFRGIWAADRFWRPPLSAGCNLDATWGKL